MLHVLNGLREAWSTGATERLVLLANHILSREPAACERLRAHQGRQLEISLEGWPRLLPAWPRLRFIVTPAGLLDWVGGVSEGAQPGLAAPDLHLRVDAANPAAMLAGALTKSMPAVQVDGDAQFAADVNWIVANVRWDIADDLERWFGPSRAAFVASLGPALAQGLKQAVAGAEKLAGALRSRAP